MNFLDKFDAWGINPNKLDKKKEQTTKKIEYVTLDEGFVDRFEPVAAPVKERLDALRRISEAGHYTWVSIEPYPTPNMIEQSLAELLEEVSFVDRIIFGRLHYNKVVSSYSGYKEFYNRCAATVIEFCIERGIAYHIKKGTVVEGQE